MNRVAEVGSLSASAKMPIKFSSSTYLLFLHRFCIAFKRNCKFAITKPRICRDNSKCAPDKNFVAIFAFAERLPTSATLLHAVTQHLGNTKAKTNANTNAQLNVNSFMVSIKQNRLWLSTLPLTYFCRFLRTTTSNSLARWWHESRSRKMSMFA